MMSTSTLPERRFIVALYEILGDNPKRLAPFGEVMHHSQLTDTEAHAAFAALKNDGLVKSNSSGCVALTDVGRKAARGPAPRRARQAAAETVGA
jgi:hypothetical protein